MITPEKIRQYLEGNIRLWGDKFNLMPKYAKEQIIWRSHICSDCMSEGQCKYCGCSVPGKLYVKKSCNDGERFPDMMDKGDWEEYKKENKINLDFTNLIMKTYDIILSGSAIEAYLFELDEVRIQILNETNILNSNINDVLQSISYDDPGEASVIITGLLQNDFLMTVRDTMMDEIKYIGNNLDVNNEREYLENSLENQSFLVYENQIKGEIIRLELITDHEFDINKLKLVFTNIGFKNILTSLNYDGEYLAVDTDYLDYESTGKEIYKVINN
jgi:hypothetical protein